MYSISADFKLISLPLTIAFWRNSSIWSFDIPIHFLAVSLQLDRSRIVFFIIIIIFLRFFVWCIFLVSYYLSLSFLYIHFIYSSCSFKFSVIHFNNYAFYIVCFDIFSHLFVLFRCLVILVWKVMFPCAHGLFSLCHIWKG